MGKIPVKMIDENKESALADKYNYYYVPSYFIGDTKLFEGHAERPMWKRCSKPLWKPDRAF